MFAYSPVYSPEGYIIAIIILAVVIYLLKSYYFKKVKFDADFTKALAAPIIFAILVRLLADAGVVGKSQWWSVTPGIYIVGIIYGLIIITIALAVQDRFKIPYWKITLFLGAITSLPVFYKLYQHMLSPLRFFAPVALATIASAIVYGFSKLHPKLKFLSVRYNYLIFFAHFLDASGTFIGMTYFGFSEEHMVAGYLIHLTGTALIMYPMKLLVVGLALYILENWYKEEGKTEVTYYRIIKVTMFIIGIGPGIRNALLLTLVR